MVLAVVVLLLGVVGVGGFFGYKKFKDRLPWAPKQQAAVETPAPQGAPAPVVAETPPPPPVVETPPPQPAPEATPAPPPSAAPVKQRPKRPASAKSAKVVAAAPSQAPVQTTPAQVEAPPELPPQPIQPAQHPPVVKPVPRVVYSGPQSGVLVWSGQLSKNGNITIEGGSASVGAVQAGALPGVPVMIGEIQPRDVGLAEPPSASNGWKRIVLRSKANRRSVVTIQWSVLK